MKKICLTYLLTLILAFSGYANVLNDTISTQTTDSLFLQAEDWETDSLSIYKPAVIDTIVVEEISKVKFKPDPLRSIWLGAVIPGYGQIVNRKYWKLPFVYGGFLGFAYAINFNNRQYTSYKNAYRDIIDDDPNTNYHIKILPKGYTIDTFPGGISTYQQRLKTMMEQFRQFRDLSVILGVVYYGLVLLEAYVDAELYDFDISPNLTLNVQPSKLDFKQLNNQSNLSPSAYGVRCNIRF